MPPNTNGSVAFLHAFDCPDMTSDNQAERFRASLPIQSLALMNNPLVMRTSKAFAQEVLEKSGNNYEDAVKNLERAIDLKPEDPTINDHLGDAYWRVGRTLEARFQWAHARDLKPEAEELPKIEAKIENGLPEDTSSSASADKKKEDGKGG